VSGYRIDEGVLQDVSVALERGTGAVAAGRRAVGSVPPVGLGTDGLDAAAADLLAGWSAALTGVAGTLADTSAGVRRCLADYTDAEQRIAGLFRDGQ
jgi:hypothetical protein